MCPVGFYAPLLAVEQRLLDCKFPDDLLAINTVH